MHEFGCEVKATSLKLYSILKGESQRRGSESLALVCMSQSTHFSFEILALIKDIKDKVCMSCFMFSA
jgi:hypothetical protein